MRKATLGFCYFVLALTAAAQIVSPMPYSKPIYSPNEAISVLIRSYCELRDNQKSKADNLPAIQSENYIQSLMRLSISKIHFSTPEAEKAFGQQLEKSRQGFFYDLLSPLNHRETKLLNQAFKTTPLPQLHTISSTIFQNLKTNSGLKLKKDELFFLIRETQRYLAVQVTLSAPSVATRPAAPLSANNPPQAIYTLIQSYCMVRDLSSVNQIYNPELARLSSSMIQFEEPQGAKEYEQRREASRQDFFKKLTFQWSTKEAAAIRDILMTMPMPELQKFSSIEVPNLRFNSDEWLFLITETKRYFSEQVTQSTPFASPTLSLSSTHSSYKPLPADHSIPMEQQFNTQKTTASPVPPSDSWHGILISAPAQITPEMIRKGVILHGTYRMDNKAYSMGSSWMLKISAAQTHEGTSRPLGQEDLSPILPQPEEEPAIANLKTEPNLIYSGFVNADIFWTLKTIPNPGVYYLQLSLGETQSNQIEIRVLPEG